MNYQSKFSGKQIDNKLDKISNGNILVNKNNEISITFPELNDILTKKDIIANKIELFVKIDFINEEPCINTILSHFIIENKNKLTLKKGNNIGDNLPIDFLKVSLSELASNYFILNLNKKGSYNVECWGNYDSVYFSPEFDIFVDSELIKNFQNVELSSFSAGSIINVNGIQQDTINFTSDPQTQITEIKTTLDSLTQDAPEAFDTLKEIADWIKKDEQGAVDLAKKIEGLEKNKVNTTDIINSSNSDSETQVFSCKKTKDLLNEKSCIKVNSELKQEVNFTSDPQTQINSKLDKITDSVQAKSIGIDTIPIINSNNLITSGGVAAALKNGGISGGGGENIVFKFKSFTGDLSREESYGDIKTTLKLNISPEDEQLLMNAFNGNYNRIITLWISDLSYKRIDSHSDGPENYDMFITGTTLNLHSLSETGDISEILPEIAVTYPFQLLNANFPQHWFGKVDGIDTWYYFEGNLTILSEKFYEIPKGVSIEFRATGRKTDYDTSGLEIIGNTCNLTLIIY